MPDDVFKSEPPSGDPKEEPGFAELFESYLKDNPTLRVGDRIQGKIIAIGSENVFVDTGTKADGVVEKKEIMDAEGNLRYGVGDRLDLYIVSIKDDEIRLSGSISGQGGERLLYDAYRGRIPVEGRVIESCKGGFRVSIMRKTAFCPISQIDCHFVEEPEAYLNKSFHFLITRIEKNGRNLVVSRRDLLEREMEEAKQEFYKTVKPGDILTARVTKIMPYGVFAEILPGVEGMIHVSELSWTRVENPDQIVKIDDTLRVKLLDIKPEANRLSLSVKQVDANPWDTVGERFHSGDKVAGKVTRCADFGAFVEIAPGIEGLVHISEMSYTKRVIKAEDAVSPGETVSVMIKEIDPLKKRISLSMRDAEGDPWVGIEEKYHAGQTVMGSIERKEGFGLFVLLEPGITGLLPRSRLENAASSSKIEKLKLHEVLPVVIEAINPGERKITLSLGDEVPKEDWKGYATEKQTSRPNAMGDLGAKLRAALLSKK